MKRKFSNSHDVARLAGVSRSAVSRAFTPGASISPATRRKIDEAAATLGYRVNRLAREMHEDQTNIVGIVAANMQTSYIAGLVERLSAELLANGLQSLLVNAGDDTLDSEAHVSLMLEYRVRAAVVLSGSPPSSIVRACEANAVKLVLINRRRSEAKAHLIHTDDQTGVELAFQRLLSDGRRRLAVVGPDTGTSSMTLRNMAFMRCAAEHQLNAVQWWSGGTGYETGARAACELTDRDGVFCVTDEIALGFLNTSRFEIGKSVPRDLSLIGFDNVAESGWSSHGLTTIHQDRARLARMVTAAILTDQEEQGESSQILPVTLIERGTTLPINNVTTAPATRS